MMTSNRHPSESREEYHNRLFSASIKEHANDCPFPDKDCLCPWNPEGVKEELMTMQILEAECHLCGHDYRSEECSHRSGDIIAFNEKVRREEEDDRIRMIVRQEIADYDRYGYSPLKEWGYED